MHRDGILKDKELLDAERTTKNYIKDLPANGRMTCLSFIVTNEDEERLENWHEFLPDLERWHGATWEDQLTTRYCLRGEKERYEKQRQQNLFEYLWYFIVSSAYASSAPEKCHYPSSDLCMQILSVIDVFSAKEDDLFLPLRIYAEGLAANAFFDEKKPEPDKKEEPEKPDEEGDNEDEDEKKPLTPDNGNALWEYSTRVMGQTILGKITASAETTNTDDTPNDTTETPKPSEKGLTAPTVSVPDMPVIGLDGRTKDGAIPYEILKQQLAFMR